MWKSGALRPHIPLSRLRLHRIDKHRGVRRGSSPAGHDDAVLAGLHDLVVVLDNEEFSEFVPTVHHLGGVGLRLGGQEGHALLVGEVRHLLLHLRLFGGRIRAFHCSDISYWFKNTDLMVTHTGGGAEPRGVSDQMSAALLAFMRTGDPNCAEIPQWPAYSPEDAPTMIFSVKSEVKNAPDRVALELMADFNPWRMSRPAPAAK